MTKNNKIGLFFILLIMAGIGGAYWYTREEDKKEARIVLSNPNSQDRTVDFEMSYQGQRVKGTAYLGSIYEKTQEGIKFLYDFDISQEKSRLFFEIRDEQNNLLKEKMFDFES